MDTLYIPNENDFRKWIKEGIKEFMHDSFPLIKTPEKNEEDLLNRKEIAKLLRISLVTLTDWMKHGLPSHKQRGRVYFMKSEVIEYIKDNKMSQLKFSSRFQNLRQEIK